MKIDYFIADLEMEADRATGVITTRIIHNDYSDIFTGIWYLRGIFSLQIKDDVKPYQLPPKHQAYALQVL